MFSKLPSSLYVKEVPNQGNGLFTKIFIPKGKEIFTSTPYSFGAGGVTTEDVRGCCHHCLKIVRDKTTSIVCTTCKVIGYCSNTCLDSAKPLHSMECKGLIELEKFRSKDEVKKFASNLDGCLYWPPVQVLSIARAINKRVSCAQNKHDDEWLKYLSRHTLSTTKADQYPLFKKFVRYLVPSYVTDDEIHTMYIAVSVNSAAVMCPSGTAAGAVHFSAFSLLNHMCQPNCDFNNDVNNEVSIYTLQDIPSDGQLCITYLNSRDRISVKEIRRKALKDLFGFDCSCVVCLEEEIIGSKFWLMDQQKRCLITPWSRLFADRVMNQAWIIICKCESMDPLKSIEMLQISLAVQRSILEHRNVMFILTIWHILLNCNILQDYRKGIEYLNSLGKMGMTAFFEYGTMTDIDEIMMLVIRSCSELGLLDIMFHNYFPKAPSADVLCMALRHEIPTSVVKCLRETYYAQAKPHIELGDLVCSTLKICDHSLKHSVSI